MLNEFWPEVYKMTQITDFIYPNDALSLSGLFLERVARSPNNIAYSHFDKTTEQWNDLTWRDMLQTVARWRCGFEREGLKVGDRVAIMLSNCPQWIQFEQAALSLGLIVVPLYANDRPDSIAYILKDTGAKVLLCPGNSFWDHLNSVTRELKELQRVITLDSCRIQNDPAIACITDWLPEFTPSAIDFTPEPIDIATIVYTSGTTGPPKGVMLSNWNILKNCHAGLQYMDIFPSDNFLSFLPLSHMLERTAGYYLPMMAGATVTFARSIPELGEDLLTRKPTVLVAVPRIFERIYGGIMTQLKAKPPLTVSLFKMAISTGWKQFQYTQGRAPWSASSLALPLFNHLVAKKVKNKLGGNLRIIISGGAPLSTEISKLFLGLGLPLYQGYGLTETSPVISVNRKECNDPQSVGLPLQGIEVKTTDNDELLVRGHCVMEGYWNNKTATADTIDEDGWLPTGDRANILENGSIRITGRLKEIIVLSNSEKVAPADMEMAISMNPLFEHTMVIGEGKPYLTLIAVLNRNLWIEFAEKLGITAEDSSVKSLEVEKAILAKVDKQLANFPGYAFIKRAALSLTPWTVEDGMLTPTLKLKRTIIEKRMANEISKMYET